LTGILVPNQLHSGTILAQVTASSNNAPRSRRRMADDDYQIALVTRRQPKDAKAAAFV
jgi:hypothetical protein